MHETKYEVSNAVSLKTNLKEINYNNIRIQIELNKLNKKWFNWDYIGDKMRFLPLETKSEGLIKEISKVLFCNSRIYVLDKQQNQILCYSDKGKFLWKINQVGKAEFEYRTITDFFISEGEGALNLYDSKSRKILTFQLNDGSFVKSKKYKSQFFNIYPYKGGYLHTTNNFIHDNESLSYMLMECNCDGELLSRLNSFSNHWNNLVIKEIAMSIQGGRYFLPDLERNAIYMIDTAKGTICRKYDFLFPNHNPNNKLSKFISINGERLSFRFDPKCHFEIINKLKKEDIVIGPLCCFETDKQSIFYFKYYDTFLILTYWPETGNYIYGLPYSNGDPLKLLLSRNPLLSSTDEEYVTAIYPFDLFNELKKLKASQGVEYVKKYLKRNPNLIKLLSIVDDNSNPMLVFITPNKR
jgi:hypothetical protein